MLLTGISECFCLPQAVQEYSVRVSFLELYNEELFDLLTVRDDSSKLRIFEDSARKVSTALLLYCICTWHIMSD